MTENTMRSPSPLHYQSPIALFPVTSINRIAEVPPHETLRIFEEIFNDNISELKSDKTNTFSLAMWGKGIAIEFNMSQIYGSYYKAVHV